MKKKVAIPALLFGAVAAGGLLYLTHAHVFKAAVAAAPPASGSGRGRRGRAARRADLSERRRHRDCLQHRRRAGPDPGPAHQHQLHRRADRPCRRPARANRSASLPGPDRPVRGQTCERDQAQLTNARANFTRYTQLGDKGWATPQLIETQKAQVGQLEAAIKADQALIEAAKVQLSYTRLTSPIDGVVGIRQIDVGNIISPTTTNGLVVVTQLDPISLIFTLPEGVLPQILKQQQATKTPLPVLAYSQDDTIAARTRAYSRWSTTRSCRRPARSSSRQPFPTSRASCGRVNWSMRGCSS